MLKNNFKFLFFLFLSLFIATLISCGGKKVSPDEYGFYHELADGVKAARDEKKNILLYVVLPGFDEESETFVSEVLHSSEYAGLFNEKFVSVVFDFGSENYLKSDSSRFVSEEDRKAADFLNEQIVRNISLARTLNLEYTPCLFLMSRDGYAFADLIYAEDFYTVEEMYGVISQYEDDFVTMQEMVEDTKKGSPVERVEAVNIIYQIIDDEYMPTLKELFKSVPQMDKKNKSGLVSYLYFVYIMEESKTYVAAGDYVSAIAVCREAAEGNYLETEEKQQAYYMAAQFMIKAGSSDFITIFGLLNNAINAAPETELAESCRVILSQASEILDKSEEKAPEVQ